MQQADFANAARNRIEVAHILGTALAYLDGLQRKLLAHSLTLCAARMRSFSASQGRTPNRNYLKGHEGDGIDVVLTGYLGPLSPLAAELLNCPSHGQPLQLCRPMDSTTIAA